MWTPYSPIPAHIRKNRSTGSTTCAIANMKTEGIHFQSSLGFVYRTVFYRGWQGFDDQKSTTPFLMKAVSCVNHTMSSVDHTTSKISQRKHADMETLLSVPRTPSHHHTPRTLRWRCCCCCYCFLSRWFRCCSALPRRQLSILPRLRRGGCGDDCGCVRLFRLPPWRSRPCSLCFFSFSLGFFLSLLRRSFRR